MEQPGGLFPFVLLPIVERSRVCLLPRQVCASSVGAPERDAAISQPLNIFVNISTVKFRKFPRVQSDAEGGLVAAACADTSFSAGSPELFSCYQGSQISPRPQILILFFNQSPAGTSYKDAVSSGCRLAGLCVVPC